MNSGYKLLIGGGILAGIAGALTYLKRLGRANVELETVTKVTPDLRKGNFRLDLTMKNPTGGSFKIKQPFVKLLYAGDMVGSSKVVNKEYTIPAFGEVKLEPVSISIPLLSALTSGGLMIAEMKKGKSVQVNVDTVTTAIVGKTQIPVKKSQTITLKQA